MLEKMIWDYVKVRYLGEKGQGMIEYALLMAFAVAVAAAVYTSDSNTGLGKALKGVVDNVTTALAKK